MLTLSYGYKKPQNLDKGGVVFPAMEDNIQRLNDHTHNGVNSAPLNPSAIVATSQSILSANWAATSGGNYSQVVTMPAGLSFNSTVKEFRLSDGTVFVPKTKFVSTTQYEIHINDNTETLTVYYK